MNKKSLRDDIGEDLVNKIDLKEFLKTVELIYRANWENGSEFAIVMHPKYDVIIGPKGSLIK